jgi:hypothetical protein
MESLELVIGLATDRMTPSHITYLSDLVSAHGAGHVALVFENEQTGSHQALCTVSDFSRVR